MDCIHFSLRDQIDRMIKNNSMSAADLTHLAIGINIDGLPLFKSSNKVMWPVLCGVLNLKTTVVFPLTLSLGNSKPSDLSFLTHFVDDISNAVLNGINCDDQNLKVNLKFIVCDALARSMVKRTKLCTGCYRCDKCETKGEWCNDARTSSSSGIVIFPQIGTLPSNESFRQRRQVLHHQGDSPLENLPVDIVKCYPIDFMHQGCLGTMRKLLFCWTRGPRSLSRQSATNVKLMDERLNELKPHVPDIFARKPRLLCD